MTPALRMLNSENFKYANLITIMPIPSNITREHIFQAMLKIYKDGIPSNQEARKKAVSYEEKKFPCKLLISWANIYANGIKLDPNPNNFQTDMAVKYLINLGFDIIEL